MKKSFAFESPGANVLIAVCVWIVAFLLLWVLMLLVHWNNRLGVIVAFIAGGLFAFGDHDTIAILTTKLLLFRGTETGQRVGPGFYFTFWFYSLDKTEVQSKQRFDIVIPAFKCQDNKKKVLIAEGSGRWRIKSGLEDVYKEQDASTIPSILTKAAEKTAMKLTPKMPYKSDDPALPQIMGEDLGEKVLIEPSFIHQCDLLGVEMTSLVLDAIAFNLDQENLDSYHDDLFERAKRQYPLGHRFTHEELEDIEANVQVRIGRARRIITPSPLLGRYDVPDHS